MKDSSLAAPPLTCLTQVRCDVEAALSLGKAPMGERRVVLLCPAARSWARP